MIFICAFMAVNPKQFSEGIIIFSEKSWFHAFEIIARATMGLIFIKYSNTTLYPSVFNIVGYGLLVVAIGLIILAPKKHKKFTLWAAQKFENNFRLIGILSIPLGGLIIFMALGM